MRALITALSVGVSLACASAAPAAELPKMKFNEVKEIADGVYFRYSSISATDKKVVFGGSNNIWVVFEDYVVVIDANFPKEARDVLAAVKKTTKKPVRYVLDTHHHGDHAYGNAVWARAGATIVAQANCARLLRVDGPSQFEKEGRPPLGRPDVRASKLKVPSLIFDNKLVLDDGKQRVEFLFFGHAHTAGDAVAYLPKQKILCTGDACVNGAHNFMGHSDSASWIRALERMEQLDIKLVCPGHGPVADKHLLGRQKRYFAELRTAVKEGIDADKELPDIVKGFKPAWYKKWTGVDPPQPNVEHVYNELTGRVAPWDLSEDFGIYEGPSPTKSSPGWTKPRRIVVPAGLLPGQLTELKRLAPAVEFLPAKTPEDAAKLAADADAVLTFGTPEVIKAGKKLRWVQVGATGVDKGLRAALKGRKVVLTSTRRINGPQVAEQTFALLLSLTRGLLPPAKAPRVKGPRTELRGKTMLVIGLGGSGTQISRRAHAFGMRVAAIDGRDQERPSFVFSLDKPAKLLERLEQADVVVLACPLTGENRNLIGAKQLKAMKKTAYLINAAHTGLVDQAALAEALADGLLAGAGLDMTDVGERGADARLRKDRRVVITAHRGPPSPEASRRQWRLYRENVRRFAAGEPLLCVVDPARGY
jgi:phosphoglycerate dehydrogenase-like enzyme/glyoxylase-like metal-dependent hydrolase (beta-lactamase superfamily II)